jgi:hypothetical protein
MRNLRRRIEALEKSRSVSHHGLQAIADRAVKGLRPDVLEPLISACGGDRAGRRLTEREAAAKRAYTEALERECQSAGFQSIRGFGRTAYIRQAVIIGLANRFSPEELQLASSALHASLRADAPKEQESAALQAWTSEHKRLCHLAGFGSVGEFDAFYAREELSEGGNQC